MTLYGKGAYFARDASYSSSTTYSRPNAQGVQHMFLARVVIGEYCRGVQNALAPPVNLTRTLARPFTLTVTLTLPIALPLALTLAIALTLTLGTYAAYVPREELGMHAVRALGLGVGVG